MRLVLGLIVVAAIGLPGLSHAQGSGMNCYANVGGRSNCGLMANALVNRLDGDPAERRGAIHARRLQQVRAVDQALKAGHCDQALALARRSGDRVLSASTARICAAAPPA